MTEKSKQHKKEYMKKWYLNKCINKLPVTKKCVVCFKKFITKNRQICCSKKCMKINDKIRRKNYCKIYRKKNKIKILLNFRNWIIKHKDEILKKRREYYRKNKTNFKKLYKKYKQKINKRNRLRRKKDINFRLISILRSRLWHALKGHSKTAKTINLIDCSIEQLKKHLEKQFKLGMSWSNYGKWEIDHIIPCCKFNLRKESEQKKCFNYTNLQPLWKTENRQKYNKCVI